MFHIFIFNIQNWMSLLFDTFSSSFCIQFVSISTFSPILIWYFLLLIKNWFKIGNIENKYWSYSFYLYSMFRSQQMLTLKWLTNWMSTHFDKQIEFTVLFPLNHQITWYINSIVETLSLQTFFFNFILQTIFTFEWTKVITPSPWSWSKFTH